MVSDGQNSPIDSPFQSLSEVEVAEKQRLEAVVVGAVWAAGKALQQLRDQKLYRDTHSSIVKPFKNFMVEFNDCKVQSWKEQQKGF